MQELSGQRALVTGGTSGIGRATAEALAREGARVLISGRNVARGAEVVAAIEAVGGEAEFVRADLESRNDVHELAERASEVDILVNNAGVFPVGATHELSRLRQGELRERSHDPRRWRAGGGVTASGSTPIGMGRQCVRTTPPPR